MFLRDFFLFFCFLPLWRVLIDLSSILLKDDKTELKIEKKSKSLSAYIPFVLFVICNWLRNLTAA